MVSAHLLGAFVRTFEHLRPLLPCCWLRHGCIVVQLTEQLLVEPTQHLRRRFLDRICRQVESGFVMVTFLVDRVV
ncbi:MAG: hypothetical protein M3O70_26110 [Actinomycetota bacterium]|nr:hypothetical protein [Actinomycetota bacterium]